MKPDVIAGRECISEQKANNKRGTQSDKCSSRVLMRPPDYKDCRDPWVVRSWLDRDSFHSPVRFPAEAFLLSFHR